jgi:hypothetical protein
LLHTFCAYFQKSKSKTNWLQSLGSKKTDSDNPKHSCFPDSGRDLQVFFRHKALDEGWKDDVS